MRPDFWLAQVQTDRYSLTPCSPLGKREFPDIQLGRKLGDFLMLSHDESQFLLEVWGLHFKVKQLDHRSTGGSVFHFGTPVVDTRPKPTLFAPDPSPGRLFASHSVKQRHIATSYRFANSKRRRFSLKAHAHLLQPL